jgi:hypothetical protein
VCCGAVSLPTPRCLAGGAGVCISCRRPRIHCGRHAADLARVRSGLQSRGGGDGDCGYSSCPGGACARGVARCAALTSSTWIVPWRPHTRHSEGQHDTARTWLDGDRVTNGAGLRRKALFEYADSARIVGGIPRKSPKFQAIRSLVNGVLDTARLSNQRELRMALIFERAAARAKIRVDVRRRGPLSRTWLLVCCVFKARPLSPATIPGVVASRRCKLYGRCENETHAPEHRGRPRGREFCSREPRGCAQ